MASVSLVVMNEYLKKSLQSAVIWNDATRPTPAGRRKAHPNQNGSVALLSTRRRKPGPGSGRFAAHEA